MVTTVTTWLIVIGATILASLMMWVAARSEIGGKLAVIRTRFFCPTKDKEVEVEFLASRREPENLLEVMHCSAFQKGEAMDCDRACLHWPQAREAHPLFPQPYFPVLFPLF